MEEKVQKCSSKQHMDKDAIIYCQECKIYMCNKCKNFHSELCEDHTTYNLDKEIIESEEDFCKEKNHTMKLDFFCKNHSQLCCAAFLSKLDKKGNGQHKDYDVCVVEEIINEKKDKLNENIHNLEESYKELGPNIYELKQIFEKIYESKNQFKINIQIIFTKIRTELNNREDQLLLDVDNKFYNLYFKEELIKKTENLPNKIKLHLSKIKKENIDKIKYNSLIKYLTDTENFIKDLNIISEKIKKFNLNTNNKLEFYPKDEEKISKYLEQIKLFGKIGIFGFKFKACPI